MLVVFFTIVFIAEIIVTVWIISAIKKLDTKVLKANLAINQISPEIISAVSLMRASVEIISTKFGATVDFIEEKKCSCFTTLQKGILTTLLFHFTKIPGKKLFTIIDTLLTIRKIVKNFIKK